ncbi:hypothetical protein GCM10009838_70170 [Catenulispora subtropica]|uniref:Uncharacterized protein n=1 Tax=Catenulispora subtropica TaxID=450798 RepID=A0ABN2T0J0_9ACTN
MGRTGAGRDKSGGDASRHQRHGTQQGSGTHWLIPSTAPLPVPGANLLFRSGFAQVTVRLPGSVWSHQYSVNAASEVRNGSRAPAIVDDG